MKVDVKYKTSLLSETQSSWPIELSLVGLLETILYNHTCKL